MLRSVHGYLSWQARHLSVSLHLRRFASSSSSSSPEDPDDALVKEARVRSKIASEAERDSQDLLLRGVDRLEDEAAAAGSGQSASTSMGLFAAELRALADREITPPDLSQYDPERVRIMDAIAQRLAKRFLEPFDEGRHSKAASDVSTAPKSSGSGGRTVVMTAENMDQHELFEPQGGASAGRGTGAQAAPAPQRTEAENEVMLHEALDQTRGRRRLRMLRDSISPTDGSAAADELDDGAGPNSDPASRPAWERNSEHPYTLVPSPLAPDRTLHAMSAARSPLDGPSDSLDAADFDDGADADEARVADGDADADDFEVEHESDSESIRRLMAGLVASPAGSQRREIVIRESDLNESFVRSSGPGGQCVNKRSSCVQLLHVPTGTRVKCQITRSLQKNRRLAREILKRELDDIVNGKNSANSAQRVKKRRQDDRLRRRREQRAALKASAASFPPAAVAAAAGTSRVRGPALTPATAATAAASAETAAKRGAVRSSLKTGDSEHNASILDSLFKASRPRKL
jgi:hypothetical protein